MNKILNASIVTFLVLFLSISTLAQSPPDTTQPDKSKKTLIVDAACGQCKFGLTGEGCNLAIRLEGKPYFVDGTTIDDHGDAHAKDGFCNAIRKASVRGTVTNNRFAASYFRLEKDPATIKKEN